MSSDIRVITTKPISLIERIDPASYDEVLKVDFSKYFVIIVSHGVTWPEKGIEVERVVQNKDNIFVFAQFQPAQATTAVVPVLAYPYQIVKVSKDSMTQFGEITFKLVDQSGKERAASTQVVPIFKVSASEKIFK